MQEDQFGDYYRGKVEKSKWDGRWETETSCRGMVTEKTYREGSEQAVHSTRMPGRGQRKTQADLEVSKLGGKVVSLIEPVDTEINCIGKWLWGVIWTRWPNLWSVNTISFTKKTENKKNPLSYYFWAILYIDTWSNNIFKNFKLKKNFPVKMCENQPIYLFEQFQH